MYSGQSFTAYIQRAGAKFRKLLATAVEDIFMVLIFEPPRGAHTHIDQSAISWFKFSLSQTYPRKKELCTM